MSQESIDGKAKGVGEGTTDILQYWIDPACNMTYRVFQAPNQQPLATLLHQDMRYNDANSNVTFEKSEAAFNRLIVRFVEMNKGRKLALVGMPTDANFMDYMARQGLSPVRTTTDLQMTAEYMTDF